MYVCMYSYVINFKTDYIIFGKLGLYTNFFPQGVHVPPCQSWAGVKIVPIFFKLL